MLPLPREAGRALVAYLRQARPSADDRRVFLQHLGSRRGRPLSSTAVSEVVARALRRAKVDAPLSRAYVFRHTVASRLVQRGSSLKEVADFLGHRSLDTTTIYAKLDLPSASERRTAVAGGDAMTPPRLLALVDEYLTIRRGLGFESRHAALVAQEFRPVCRSDRPSRTDHDRPRGAMGAGLPVARPGTSDATSVGASPVRAVLCAVRRGHGDPTDGSLGPPPAPQTASRV